MREREIILLMQYIMNNKQELEGEVKELQNKLRYRKIDVTDCTDLMLCRQRLDTFNTVTKDIVALLHLGTYKDFE